MHMKLVTRKSDCKKTTRDALIISPELIKIGYKYGAYDNYLNKKPSHKYFSRIKKLYSDEVLLTETFILN